MGKKVTQVDKILSFVKTNNIKFIDMKFMDFPGQWQHFSIPANQLNKTLFPMVWDLTVLQLGVGKT